MTLVPRRGGMSPRGTRSTDDSHKRSEEVEHNVRCEHWRSMLRRVALSAFRTTCLPQQPTTRASCAGLFVRFSDSRTKWRGRAQCLLRAPTVHAAQGRFVPFGHYVFCSDRRLARAQWRGRARCSLRAPVRAPSRWCRAAVRAAELAVAARDAAQSWGVTVWPVCRRALGPCRASRPPMVAPHTAVTAGGGLAAARVRVQVTRAGAAGRGSCGVAAWRAGRSLAWPRRCDRARCCRIARPSASRRRARAGCKHRTGRSR